MTLMDTAQLLGSLGDFVGAILIAVTLIYLSVQLRQNTRALHAQTRQASLSSDQLHLLAILEHPDLVLKPRGVGGPMSPEDHVKLSFYWTAIMRSRQFAWLQYRAGIMDEVQWRQEVLIISRVIGGKVGRLWWETIGRALFTSEFAAFVDELIGDRAIGSGDNVLNWSNV